MRFKLFQYWDGEDNRIFGSKGDAVRDAKQVLADPEYDYLGDEIEIEEVETVEINKTNFITIINEQGGAYVAAKRVVQIVKRKGRKS